MKLTKLLKEFKSQAFFNGNMKIGQVYSNPYARSFVNEEGDEVERESGLNLEQKQAFLEAVKSYKQYGESIYRQHADLKEVYGTIRELVEVAQHMTIDETQDWFDGVTVSRHMKRMNESFKVFEKTLKEVTTLQQRLESAYDEIGEVLGKYYEINEKLDPVGQEDGDIDNDGDEDASDEYLLNRRKTVAKAIANESTKLTDILKKKGESVNEFVYPLSKMSDTFNLHFQRVIEKEFPRYVFYIQDRDVYLGNKKIVSLTGSDSVNSAVAKVKKKLGVKESVNEVKEGDVVKVQVGSISKPRWKRGTVSMVYGTRFTVDVNGKLYSVDKKDINNTNKIKFESVNEKMRPAVKKLLNQKGYSPIFQAIDKSKRDLKQMGYTRGEIKDTLIDMFGDDDPKILQKINESVNESTKLTDILKKKGESLNEENARLNKKVKSYLDDYLRDEKKNSPEHQHAIMLIMKGALVGANFHSEAKQLDKYFPKAKQSELVGTAMEDVIEDKGIQISKWAKWDGYDIIDAFAFYTSMTIGGGFGNKLKSLKESVNESTKLTDILKRK